MLTTVSSDISSSSHTVSILTLSSVCDRTYNSMSCDLQPRETGFTLLSPLFQGYRIVFTGLCKCMYAWSALNAPVTAWVLVYWCEAVAAYVCVYVCLFVLSLVLLYSCTVCCTCVRVWVCNTHIITLLVYLYKSNPRLEQSVLMEGGGGGW